MGSRKIRHHCASVGALVVPASAAIGETVGLPVSRKVRLAAVSGTDGVKFGPTQAVTGASAHPKATKRNTCNMSVPATTAARRCLFGDEKTERDDEKSNHRRVKEHVRIG